MGVLLFYQPIYNRRKGLTHRQHPVVRTPSGPDTFEYRRKEPFFPSQEIYGCPFIFLPSQEIYGCPFISWMLSMINVGPRDYELYESRIDSFFPKTLPVTG